MAKKAKKPDYQPAYSPATAFSAEGSRVGLVTCLRCGAAVLLSMAADSTAIHEKWHEDTGGVSA